MNDEKNELVPMEISVLMSLYWVLCEFFEKYSTVWTPSSEETTAESM